VAEYLHSANNDLLVPLHVAENEIDFFENDGDMMYYHIIDANLPANFVINN